jgi:hypothetical protein
MLRGWQGLKSKLMAEFEKRLLYRIISTPDVKTKARIYQVIHI